ncbi:MAG: hypothetical protein BWK78_04690 [Thiotrichaceae bacterium IS1]|nr:MAG: hypothetical protein BWK78_04690 [Thiotrichaceae bacterium IS1]
MLVTRLLTSSSNRVNLIIRNGFMGDRRELYPSHLKSYLLELQGVRNSADYKWPLVSKAEANEALKNLVSLLK